MPPQSPGDPDIYLFIYRGSPGSAGLILIASAQCNNYPVSVKISLSISFLWHICHVFILFPFGGAIFTTFILYFIALRFPKPTGMMASAHVNTYVLNFKLTRDKISISVNIKLDTGCGADLFITQEH